MKRALPTFTGLLVLLLPLAAAWGDDPWDADPPDPAAIAQALEQVQAKAAAAEAPSPADLDSPPRPASD